MPHHVLAVRMAGGRPGVLDASTRPRPLYYTGGSPRVREVYMPVTQGVGDHRTVVSRVEGGLHHVLVRARWGK